MTRFSYVPAPAMFDLRNACASRDYRDVDVRCMLPDEIFDEMFPNAAYGPSHWNARWSLLSVTISQGRGCRGACA